MRLQLKSIFLVLAVTLAAARPNPEAQPEYRSGDEEADADPISSEARSQNSISSEEREADLRLQPYGALKLAVRDEPWGALRVSVALAEQERMASERLLTERESVEVAATPEPDTEIVESLSADDAPRCDQEAPTTLVLRPYAKAVAGAGGTAIAAPESRAITRHASDVIVFEPHVVAIVGPGGHAVATSRLIIENIPN